MSARGDESTCIVENGGSLVKWNVMQHVAQHHKPKRLRFAVCEFSRKNDLKGCVPGVASIERSWIGPDVNANDGALGHLDNKPLREVAVTAANF